MAISLSCACTETIEPVGYDVPPVEMNALVCPTAYPTNFFSEVLGVSESALDAKLAAGFGQLFSGVTSDELNIYFPVSGTDTAYVYDTLHEDIRTEGLGLGMIIAVSLDRQDEFDRLWRYAKANHRIATGLDAGYYWSSCDVSSGETRVCLDPYGLQQFTMALLLARERWGTAVTGIDYDADARELFTLLRTKVLQNGGVVSGITDTFDSATLLVYDEPNNGGQKFQRTALSLPGYYDLWATVTGDAFYTEAGNAARGLLATAADSTTGLYPNAAYFDGTPRSGAQGYFAAEAFRVDINLVIDSLWGTATEHEGYQIQPIDKMLGFFSSEGIASYGSGYTLDGRVITSEHADEIVMANGVIAARSSVADRQAYIQAAWDLAPPTGAARYYAGLMYLMGNLILGGRLRVCP